MRGAAIAFSRGGRLKIAARYVRNQSARVILSVAEPVGQRLRRWDLGRAKGVMCKQTAENACCVFGDPFGFLC